jgi:hypothetical protein
MNKNDLTQNTVRTLFEYRDGSLFWKERIARCLRVGKQAGHLEQDGYIRVRINKVIYPIHRIIFLHHYGYLPKFIDHKDGNRSNNLIENLRECTARENQYNRKVQSRKFAEITSKWKGVCWLPTRKRWIARIRVDNKLKFLGHFLNEDDAAVAYNSAAKTYFGEFACLNVISGNEPVVD